MPPPVLEPSLRCWEAKCSWGTSTGSGWCAQYSQFSWIKAFWGKLAANGCSPELCSTVPGDSREWQLLSALKCFLASLSLISHASGSLALPCAVAEPPFSISSTFSEYIGYGGILQMDPAPRTPRAAPLLLLFGGHLRQKAVIFPQTIREG